MTKLLAEVLPLNARTIGVFGRARGSGMVARGVVVHVVVGVFLFTEGNTFAKKNIKGTGSVQYTRGLTQATRKGMLFQLSYK